MALAYVDGGEGISRVLGNPYEYLRSAREVTDVPAMIDDYIRRIPYSAPDNWVTHLAGHPPGALLVFVAMVKLGLGGDYAAGLVVTIIAATIAPAVMSTLRTLDREDFARRVAPFLVLTPSAVFLAVSADAMFAAVAAWGLACLAMSATRTQHRPDDRLVGRGRSAARLLRHALLRTAAAGHHGGRDPARRPTLAAAARSGRRRPGRRAGVRRVRLPLVGGVPGAARALLRRRRQHAVVLVLGLGQSGRPGDQRGPGGGDGPGAPAGSGLDDWTAPCCC